MSTGVSDSLETESLRYLWTPELDSLFSLEGRLGVPSAWYGHVPFAHWIVGAAKPRVIVELGTQYGVSYCAFCQAVVNHGLDTRCFAVDTWKGDDQAGYYGEEVYADLRAFQDERYGAFSELMRCTFDQALPFFGERSVDLLHIDGLHTFEAVARDFEQWRPKLSETGVVLLHDTNVNEGEFGVWRLWEGLRQQFPAFEFQHEHGLGILAPGSSIPPMVLALLSLRDPVKVRAVRHRFSFLGQRWQSLAQLELHQKWAIETDALRVSFAQAQVAALEAQIQSLEKKLETQSAAQRQLRANAARRSRLMRAELAHTRALDAGAPLLVKTKGGGSDCPVVLFISAEPETPGNIYRVVRQVEALSAAGAQSSWIPIQELPARHEEIAKADIIVLWRVAWDEQVASAVETARRWGARVIFDVDDLMINPALARIEVIDGIRTTNLTESQVTEHYTRVQSTMLAADYCSAPTEELAGEIRRFSPAAMVLPNGFDSAAYKASRLAVRRRRCSPASKPLVRIGYAGGSRTHQRDFAVAVPAIAQILRERSHCRLVLFKSAHGVVPLLDLEEFADFQGLAERIEWQNFVPLSQLPEKLALFDINLAPLEIGNAFCEAKSELKFFEAALVDVPTIASPTGPFRRAIRNGVTGFLADNPQAWYSALLALVDDPGLRLRIARAAHRDVLWHYGPRRRADAMISALAQWRGHSRDATRAFALDLHRTKASIPFPIPIAESEVLFESDQLGDANLTVVIPLYNYAHYIEEALESVRAQSLELLDLIVVDDASSDASLAVALDWAGRHAQRFNRLLVLRNKANAGLGISRNTGIDAADTPYVLQLDADNRLLPDCAAVCLSAICESGAAFAYPPLQQFGDSSVLMGISPFEPGRLIRGNYIDALALVSKEAWAGVGGYKAFRIMGWEDYDFWCRLVEKGLWGCRAGEMPLAHYRVHGQSMLRTTTHHQKNTPQLIREMKQGHPWLNIVHPAGAAREVSEASSFPASSKESNHLHRIQNPERFLGRESKLKLGVVSILRNEGDEARLFVNHLAALFDYAILMDHSSIDSTGQILSEACQLYPGWRSWQIMASGFHQPSYSAFAMKELFERSDADYVVFLDADELIDVPQRKDLENALSQLKGERTVGILNWRNCAPLDWSGRPLAFGDRILASLRTSPFPKVVISRRMFEETGGAARPTFGNHGIDPGDGKEVRYQNIGELLHIPIRSLEQIKRKVTTKALTSFATVGRPLNSSLFNHRLNLIAEGNFREEDLLPLALTYEEDNEQGTDSHPIGYLPRNLQVAHVSDVRPPANTSLDPYRMFAGFLKNWKQEDAANGEVVLRGTELHLVPTGLEPGNAKDPRVTETRSKLN
jgi:glycosyltransferase involved in cell wall biosynthesis